MKNNTELNFAKDDDSGPLNERIEINGRRLKIVQKLGEGGFAFVYRVIDEQSGDQFALKKINI